MDGLKRQSRFATRNMTFYHNSENCAKHRKKTIRLNY
jgi:hypothetical protein